MKRKATFDSSFWVHAVYLNLVEFLLQDFELACTPAVETEIGQENPTGLKLKRLMADGAIQRDRSHRERVKLYGAGERAAINLALDKNLLLLIDDWKPYEAAHGYGIEVVNSLIYLVRLYDQDRLSVEVALDALARMMRRGTAKQEWIRGSLSMVALIRQKKPMKEEHDEKN